MSELTKDWKKVKLGEVAEFTNGGAWNSKEYEDSGIPVVQVTNISNDTIDLDQCKYLSPESLMKYKKHILFEGDLVIATVGSHPTQPNSVVGRVAIIPKFAQGSLLNQNAVRLSPKSKELDKKYLGHLGKSPFFRNYIIAHARGSANQVRMSIGLLKEMYVFLPSLSNQQKISSILSNYDDLIENNTRRIEILEEMAKLVYEEWFVKFRFPGHESVRNVPSELGEVPEGWKVKKLEEIASVNELSIKSGEEPKEINYIDISSVTTGKIDEIRYIAFADAPSRARRIVKHGDIIWSTVRPNRKSFSIILNPLPYLIASTGFAVITAKNTPYTYLYHALTTDDFVGYLTNNATGAAYPAVNTNDFKNANVLVPPNDLLNQFNNIVSNIFDLKNNLLDKNHNLRKTRDLLLPKLISGKIDVSDLDIRIRNEYKEP